MVMKVQDNQFMVLWGIGLKDHEADINILAQNIAASFDTLEK